MSQITKVISDTSICNVIDVFFLLSFTLFSYKYNLYIAWGIIPFFFLRNKAVYKSSIFYVFLFAAISLIYCYHGGFTSAFRVLKTMIVFLPFFFTNILQREKHDLSKYFHFFMCFNAMLVCVDFFLFFIIGRTIMTFTESGFLPRPCGLLEDSNFFSYLILIYIYYYKWTFGHYNKLFIASLFFSGSFSAIIVFLILLGVFKKRNTQGVCGLNLKILITSITFAIIFFYDWLAIHSDIIMVYIADLQVNDLLKVKIMSLTHRLTTVSHAMSEMNTVQEYLWGIGAGNARGLSEIGLNLHNSLLQMFLEMGGVLVSIVFFIILKMLYCVKQTKYVLLFCSTLILGTVMETLYNPLLAFVFYLSFIKTHDGISKV